MIRAIGRRQGMDVVRVGIAVGHFEVLIHIQCHHVRDVLTTLLIPSRRHGRHLAGSPCIQALGEVHDNPLQATLGTDNDGLRRKRIAGVLLGAKRFFRHVNRLLVGRGAVKLDRSRNRASGCGTHMHRRRVLRIQETEPQHEQRAGHHSKTVANFHRVFPLVYG